MDSTMPRPSLKSITLPVFAIALLGLFILWQGGVDFWPRIALFVAFFLMVPDTQYRLCQRKKGEALTLISGMATFYVNGLLLAFTLMLVYWKGPDGFLQENALTLAISFLMLGTLQLVFPTGKAGEPSDAAIKNPNGLFLLWAPLWIAVPAYGVVTKPELSLGQLGFFLIGLGYLVLPYPLSDGWPKLARRAAYAILLAVLLAEAFL